ncbi:hypothetical protein LJR219_002701 [Phenylobacterium sp. LjRoot219]|uniref:hypothetical protein n=1 Tax=Phenylobacterium sp. LjRoot219 TaxID=3342283 RepID=UPI003ED04CBD
MTTLTEIVATVVVQSSAAALAHFGVTLEPAPIVQPAPTPAAMHAADRVIIRTPRPAEKLASCPKPKTAPAELRV